MAAEEKKEKVVTVTFRVKIPWEMDTQEYLKEVVRVFKFHGYHIFGINGRDITQAYLVETRKKKEAQEKLNEELKKQQEEIDKLFKPIFDQAFKPYKYNH